MLYDSNNCRLCSLDSENGIRIYNSEDPSNSIKHVIEKYLPLKVTDDGKFPVTICKGCHWKLKSTVQFFDAIIQGQHKLRELWKEQVIRCKKEQDNLNAVLNNGVLLSMVIAEDGKVVEFSVEKSALFPEDHQLSLQMEGLDKPRKKRGRPRKKVEVLEPNTVEEECPAKESEVNENGVKSDEDLQSNHRKSRRRRKPTRLPGVLEGMELEKMFREEGVIDEEDPVEEEEYIIEVKEESQCDIPRENEAIGHLQDAAGCDMGELIVVHSNNRGKKELLRKKVRYVCDICGKRFMYKTRYLSHRAIHQDVSFQCSDCQEQFDNRKALTEHQETAGHTGEGIVVSQDTTLGTHYSYRFPCDLCEKSFNTRQNCMAHMRGIHKKKEYLPCKVCNKQFSYTSSLKHHILSFHGDGVRGEYECDVCSKEFVHQSSLMYHKETEHNDGRRFVCNKCGKRFKHKQLLHRHQIVHSTERPFVCNLCLRAFKCRNNLANHMATHTGQKHLSCRICSKQFLHRTSLKLHERWHAGEKPFECSVCGKCVSQKGNLLEHMRIHTGERPFQCTQCQRKFTTSSQYKLHLKRHTGEKPWQCDFCSKTFLHKDSWKAHTRRHKGEKPFQCNYCQRGFTEQWALKKHIRLHTGEKPYSCNICGRAFTDCSNLNKHRRLHREPKVMEGVENAVMNILNSEMSKEESTEDIATVETEENTKLELQTVNLEEPLQQIIYVTYQDPQNPSEPRTLHIVDQTNPTLNLESVGSDFHLLDNQGNQFHLVPMNDETQEEVDATDICNLPFTITEVAEEVQLEGTEQVQFDIEEPSNSGEESQLIEFTTKEGQHIRLFAPIKMAGLQNLECFGINEPK